MVLLCLYLEITATLFTTVLLNGYLINNFHETGVVNYIEKQYLGGELGSSSTSLEQATMVLNPTQMVLMFFIGTNKTINNMTIM